MATRNAKKSSAGEKNSSSAKLDFQTRERFKADNNRIISGLDDPNDPIQKAFFEAAEKINTAKISDEERIQQAFKAFVEQKLPLVNLQREESRTFTTYAKTQLRQYLKSPKTNETRIRSLSQFLYRYCYPYRKLIWYKATMFDLKFYSVIPEIDITKSLNSKKVKKSFYQAANKMEEIALDQCMLPMLLVAYMCDSSYGYIWDDDNTFFIQLLDGNYCKISSIDNGVLRFAFDFSYFDSHSDQLNYYAPEFKQKYEIYGSDTTQRWQELDYEHEICLKVNSDDLTMSIPPYTPLFEQMIDNVDLQSIQNVKDQLSIYKLLVARLQPLSGATSADDFEIDPKLALKYYERMVAQLPPEIGSCISPMPIDTIEFNPNDTSDTDMISNSNKNIFKNGTNSTILYSEDTGTTITTLKAIADEQTTLKALLPEIQAWANVYLTYKLGTGHAKIRYFLIGPYTRKEAKSEFLQDAQYSLPTKLAAATLDGFTPLEAMRMAMLENDVLDLSNSWQPLQSSHTQSSNGSDSGSSASGSVNIDGVKPESNTDDLTDDGADSRENQK